MCYASWNTGTLIGKSVAFFTALQMCKIDVAYTQETMWVGAKAKQVDGYKLQYSSFQGTKNRVGIMVEKGLVEQVVEGRRKSDRIMSIKLVV